MVRKELFIQLKIKLLNKIMQEIVLKRIGTENVELNFTAEITKTNVNIM